MRTEKYSMEERKVQSDVVSGDAGKYDDIINLEHFHDSKRPYMSMHDRAGQFAPFKSLAAYHEEIDKAEKEAYDF